MRIGEVAERAGVTAKTVRYYESIGLVDPPQRTDAGYRSYGEPAVERLLFIRDAQASGLSLAEIRSILELKDAGIGACDHTRALLASHLDELDRQIERLRRSRDELAALQARVAGLDPADCTDPSRCQVIDARHHHHHPA